MKNNNGLSVRMNLENQTYLIYIAELKKFKGRVRIKPQIDPLTFLKIFILETIYSGRSQHSESSYAIFNTSLYYWG